jgi:hypothetical protein
MQMGSTGFGGSTLVDDSHGLQHGIACEVEEEEVELR